MADLPLQVGDSAMREVVNIPWPIRRISLLRTKIRSTVDSALFVMSSAELSHGTP
jgi:hypothetical protein